MWNNSPSTRSSAGRWSSSSRSSRWATRFIIREWLPSIGANSRRLFLSPTDCGRTFLLPSICCVRCGQLLPHSRRTLIPFGIYRSSVQLDDVLTSSWRWESEVVSRGVKRMRMTTFAGCSPYCRLEPTLRSSISFCCRPQIGFDYLLIWSAFSIVKSNNNGMYSTCADWKYHHIILFNTVSGEMRASEFKLLYSSIFDIFCRYRITASASSHNEPRTFGFTRIYTIPRHCVDIIFGLGYLQDVMNLAGRKVINSLSTHVRSSWRWYPHQPCVFFTSRRQTEWWVRDWSPCHRIGIAIDCCWSKEKEFKVEKTFMTKHQRRRINLTEVLLEIAIWAFTPIRTSIKLFDFHVLHVKRMLIFAFTVCTFYCFRFLLTLRSTTTVCLPSWPQQMVCLQWKLHYRHNL